ncbi:hypothetical protein [Acanthopleuribacter pedis]|uniref:Uncharacterized protein n=1 Tax=Acanthopleuribacter pedis TaxID=442870 RepID=A0A8J7U7J9_9BACT|nr:hypothetical protein [Acanthopleuribacter pedis]MBO1321486.1 hypothetical protein [Acanthopleuribacter pedis]
MNMLLYLVYGGTETYWRELKFSVLSAVSFLDKEPQSDVKIVIATDQPDQVAGWPVEVYPFDQTKLTEWAGPDNYLHRSKNRLMAEIMEHYQIPCAFIDTDTYFVASPALLFTRVAPGMSVMHLPEGLLVEKHIPLADYAVGRELVDPNGDTYVIQPDSIMVNSGVVGIHPDDRMLIDRALWLVDELYGPTQIFNVEQYAMGEVLRTCTELNMSGDIIHHYWGFSRPFFHRELIRFFEESKSLSFAEQAERCGEVRAEVPRNPFGQRLRARVSRLFGSWSEVYAAAYLAVKSSEKCVLEADDPNCELAKIWREQALALLIEEREKGNIAFAEGRRRAGQFAGLLKHMLQSKVWLPVRDPALLDRFEEDERLSWDKFWAETKGLLGRLQNTRG